MPFEGYLNDLRLTLGFDISDSDTALTFVESGTPLPIGQFRVKIDDEIILVEITSGSSFDQMIRGAEGTTAVPHFAGAQITHLLTAGALDQIKRDAFTPDTFFDSPGSTEHNYAPGNFYDVGLVLVNVSGSLDVTGFQANGYTMFKWIVNVGNGDIAFFHEDSGSFPDNRIITPTGATVLIPMNCSVPIFYDVQVLRWRLLMPSLVLVIP